MQICTDLSCWHWKHCARPVRLSRREESVLWQVLSSTTKRMHSSALWCILSLTRWGVTPQDTLQSVKDIAASVVHIVTLAGDVASYHLRALLNPFHFLSMFYLIFSQIPCFSTTTLDHKCCCTYLHMSNWHHDDRISKTAYNLTHTSHSETAPHYILG